MDSISSKQDILALTTLIEENKPKGVAGQFQTLVLELKYLITSSNKTQMGIAIQALHAIFDDLKYKWIN